MKNQIHAILAVVVFVAISVLYYQLAVSNPIAYIWATYEDLLGEWAQFYLFFLALVFSIRNAFITNKYRWFFITLAVACFYVIMEEISWGQRIFGWGASDFFKKNNLQGETNLHNMLTGPYSTVLKQSLEYILAVGLSSFGLVYPLTYKYGWKFSYWVERLSIPVPPLYLAPLFVSAAFLELGPLSFNEAEIAEVFVGLALSLMSLHYLFIAQKEQKEAFFTTEQSLALSYRMLNVVFIAMLLSTATTFSIYATDEGRARSDRRISNGFEKFSGRYKDYENWDMVIFLNKKMLKESPTNTWVLRNLGYAYQQLDNLADANNYIDKAIKKDLAILKRTPGKASTTRSLVRSYRLKGETINADRYLSKALAIGLERIEKHPNSANAMYSLGKTYIMLSQVKKARALFIKAYQLKPKDKDFRREYYRYL